MAIGAETQRAGRIVLKMFRKIYRVFRANLPHVVAIPARRANLYTGRVVEVLLLPSRPAVQNPTLAELLSAAVRVPGASVIATGRRRRLTQHAVGVNQQCDAVTGLVQTWKWTCHVEGERGAEARHIRGKQCGWNLR
jgi:hypothetical protein